MMTKELLTKDYLLSHLNEALEQNQNAHVKSDVFFSHLCLG